MAHAGPRALGGILTELASALGLDDPRERLLFARWDEAAGPALSAACQPDRLDGGRLGVSVASSVWQYELTMRREELRDRINAFLKSQGVEEVREVSVRTRMAHGR